MAGVTSCCPATSDNDAGHIIGMLLQFGRNVIGAEGSDHTQGVNTGRVRGPAKVGSQSIGAGSGTGAWADDCWRTKIGGRGTHRARRCSHPVSCSPGLAGASGTGGRGGGARGLASYTHTECCGRRGAAREGWEVARRVGSGCGRVGGGRGGVGRGGGDGGVYVCVCVCVCACADRCDYSPPLNQRSVGSAEGSDSLSTSM